MKIIDRKKGFSIVELLVVMVILGVLAAIAIPSFNGSKMKADLADAATVLVSINLKIAQNKINMLSGNITKANIEGIVKANAGISNNAAQKFNFGVKCADDNCLKYHLYAQPKGKEITKGLWLGSEEAMLYTCDASLDLISLDSVSNNSKCTK